ncbi:LysR substrate-binding domain-containing protein [Pandoraea norimbergensis]|uniref:HTH lysR-type domain-containing protein n=2 Tax=Pseudomonadota TaxID=1224 RepID=A0ABN4JLP2_9BURK|nr:LysR substrate-binding domain-containing protein [Pandoraea norimbergensis]ALS61869.1 hypothetical protein AT302_20885 [Pandoraea norimbergensis]
MMTLKQIEAFRAVMLGRSMTEAAKLLFVTQSAVSKIMREFEEEVGFALFSRRKGGLVPTAAATALYTQVERVFVGLDQVSQTAERIRQQHQGQLRVVAMSALSSDLLQSAIARFRQQHPKVGVSLEIYNSSEVTNLVASGLFDIGYSMTPVERDKVRAGTPWRVNCVCLLPPRHRLARKRVVTARDLENEPFISFASGNTTRLAVDSLFKSENIRRQTEVEASWSIAVSAMVAKGLGVAIIDPFTAEVAKQCGCIVRPFQPAIEFTFAELRALRAVPDPLADAFSETVRECLGLYVGE